MHTTNLRKVGGSVMLAVPPALLEMLQLQSGAKVGITVERGRLVVQARLRPRYTLGELLGQCDPKVRKKRASKPRSKSGSKRSLKQERIWLASKPVGRELI